MKFFLFVIDKYSVNETRDIKQDRNNNTKNQNPVPSQSNSNKSVIIKVTPDSFNLVKNDSIVK